MKRIGLLEIMAVMAFAVSMAVPAEAAKKSKRSFFNSVEVRSSNLKPFKKWRAALKRYSREKKGKTIKKRVPRSVSIFAIMMIGENSFSR